MKSEKQKMLGGELYNAFDAELINERTRARELLRRFNQTTPDETDTRNTIIQGLFGKAGRNVWIEPPFFCDYGYNILMERGVFFNFNCTILDCNRVFIGEGTVIGPLVQIYTAHHPTDPGTRKEGVELENPVFIGKNLWIGGGTIICPGVIIGNNPTIGAGSVVTQDIPPNVVAAGNPCRVIRELCVKETSEYLCP